MRLITNNRNVNMARYEELIDIHYEALKVDLNKNRKKIIELCHAAKFLMHLDLSFEIRELREQPDFLIGNGTLEVGLEHQVLLNPEKKQLEGYFENIGLKIEDELKKDPLFPDIHINIIFNRYSSTRQIDKNKLIKHSVVIIKNKVFNGFFERNIYIDSLYIMSHDRISISSSLGGWFQNKLNLKILNNSIRRKEMKLDKYKKNLQLPQWLLIVIDSSGESSYVFDDDFIFDKDSKFDKIYLLEDFANRVYELK